MERVKWSKSCLEDIGSEEEFLRVKFFLERSLDSLYLRTKQIVSVHRKVRRLRIGNKRLFFFFGKKEICCFAYKDRKNCYSPITIKNMKKLIKKLENEGFITS